MGEKYKVKKSDLRTLFASADMMMDCHYHDLYKRLGWERGTNGNFHCWNTAAHGQGTDAHASMSVDNRNGQWHCFTCQIKGNFQSYFTNYLKGGSYGDSYTDFIIDFLNMSESLHFSTEKNDPEYEKNAQEMRDLCDKMQGEKFQNSGKKWILSGELTEMIKAATTIPMAELDGYVDRLLKDKSSLDYLFETRRITPDIIKKYHLGLNEKNKFIFPIIGADGSLINLKAYDPRGSNSDYKWSYPHKDHGYGPTPINHFTHQKLYFFGGEPDMYCAISMGIGDAVTFGSEAITDVDKVFGPERARQLFLGKECVICLDADDTGVVQAKKLAASLYPYASQIKVIDLNVSHDINPYGLDPNLTVDVIVKDKSKKKRVEKDFTDFIKKNGFDKSAKEKFDDLVDNTTVYTQNVDRVKKEIFKVTLQECRMPRYYSHDGTKILQLMAAVSDFNNKALQVSSKINVSCNAMGHPDNICGSCKNCEVSKTPGFNSASEMIYSFVREIPPEHAKDPLYIKVSEHDMLGLVEVTEQQKISQQKKLCKINDNCKLVTIADSKHEKLLHVRLSRDVNEFGDTSSASGSNAADIDVEAYMAGESDIYPNRSYRFEAVQTTAWTGQHAVLFIHKAEPIATCIETFKMDEQTHEILQTFKPKANENIEQHLKRRYDIFANAAGITGRRDLFFMNDMAFFSPLVLKSKLLPEVTRGWVEILIAGDTRTCKTMTTNWLHNHYKIGDIVTGSTAVTRSGLLGGTGRDMKGRPSIMWGKFPMNDGGLVIIDELSNVSEAVLNDLTGCRSSGIASIDGIVSGKVLARCRKIMLSNQRVWKSDQQKNYTYGIEFLRDLCCKDEILSRFDWATVVRRTDIDPVTFSCEYNPLATDFTELQCQTLIRYVYSRTPDQMIYEDGFDELVNKYQAEFLEKYHSSTQLVNQEMRAKLVRMSCSLASLLYSTLHDDWDKILVKKEHVAYIAKALNESYDHPNMALDKYSEMKRKLETLGDMSFMENICKYIDIHQIINDDEFSEKHVQQIFYDYLERVQVGSLYIPDAKTGAHARVSNRQKTFENVPKLIGLLISRNCFSRTKKGSYRKTKQFNDWLVKRSEMGDAAPTSDILELDEDKQNPNVIKAAEKFVARS